MPTNPTVEEVRELLVSLEPQETEFAIVETQSAELTRDGCKTVAAICRHYLASPMTAGEFAGLVKRRLSENKQFHEANANMPVRSLSDSLDKKSHEEKARLCGLANDVLCNLARENNITIVEPKK